MEMTEQSFNSQFEKSRITSPLLTTKVHEQANSKVPT